MLLDCSQWKRALRTVHAVENCKGETVPDTPLRFDVVVLFQEKLDSAFPAITLNLRMLVRRFPELAEKVFDACITKKEKEVMEFDFQFLDDTYSLERVEKEDKVE